MTTYHSPTHQWNVKAVSEQEAAWEFAIRMSDRKSGSQKASRPVRCEGNRWMSVVSMKAGPKPVWFDLRTEATPVKNGPQPLRGFCKKV